MSKHPRILQIILFYIAYDPAFSLILARLKRGRRPGVNKQPQKFVITPSIASDRSNKRALKGPKWQNSRSTQPKRVSNRKPGELIFKVANGESNRSYAGMATHCYTNSTTDSSLLPSPLLAETGQIATVMGQRYCLCRMECLIIQFRI